MHAGSQALGRWSHSGWQSSAGRDSSQFCASACVTLQAGKHVGRQMITL
jgi:hypothetical protein